MLVLDESPLFRRQLVVALEQHPDVEVMAESAESAAAIAHAEDLCPDVVFLSMALPPLGGPATAVSLHEVAPGARIAMIIGGDDDDLLQGVRAGAIGFAPREALVAHSGPVARALVAGRPVLTARVATAVLDAYAAFEQRPGGVPGAHIPPPAITSAERRVLGRLAEGRTLGEAGTDLGVSATTAANRVMNALERLRRHARAEALALAAADGPPRR